MKKISYEIARYILAKAEYSHFPIVFDSGDGAILQQEPGILPANSLQLDGQTVSKTSGEGLVTKTAALPKTVVLEPGPTEPSLKDLTASNPLNADSTVTPASAPIAESAADTTNARNAVTAVLGVPNAVPVHLSCVESVCALITFSNFGSTVLDFDFILFIAV
jgi:hypothetical protein